MHVSRYVYACMYICINRSAAIYLFMYACMHVSIPERVLSYSSKDYMHARVNAHIIIENVYVNTSLNSFMHKMHGLFYNYTIDSCTHIHMHTHVSIYVYLDEPLATALVTRLITEAREH